MGLEFKDVGYGLLVVVNILLGGYVVVYIDIKVGDVLFRCSVFEIDVYYLYVKLRKFEFDVFEFMLMGCLLFFEMCMNVLRLMVVYLVGFKYFEVTCEFKRDIDDRVEYEDYARLMEMMICVGRFEVD